MISAASKTSARSGRILAPFATYSASGKAASVPAPASTTTSKPAFTSPGITAGNQRHAPLARIGLSRHSDLHQPSSDRSESPARDKVEPASPDCTDRGTDRPAIAMHESRIDRIASRTVDATPVFQNFN